MHTAQELVRALTAMGLSQSEIARRTSIPQPRLSRWQTHGAPAGADDALKLRALHEQLRATAAATERALAENADAQAQAGEEARDAA